MTAHQPIQAAAQTAEPVTLGAVHSFETTILRTVGNMSNGAEREYAVEVEYRITPGGYTNDADQIDIIQVKGIDGLTGEEWWQLEEQAEADAADHMDDWWLGDEPAAQALTMVPPVGSAGL